MSYMAYDILAFQEESDKLSSMFHYYLFIYIYLYIFGLLKSSLSSAQTALSSYSLAYFSELQLFLKCNGPLPLKNIAIFWF